MEVVFIIFGCAIIEHVFAGGFVNYPTVDIGEVYPSNNLLIFTKDGPIPEYLLGSPFKLFPFPKGGVSRRMDDITIDGMKNSNVRNKNSTERNSAKRPPTVRPPWIRQRNKKLLDTANRSTTLGTYAQKYQTAGGKLTVASRVPQKESGATGDVTRLVKGQLSRPPRRPDIAAKSKVPSSNVTKTQPPTFIVGSKKQLTVPIQQSPSSVNIVSNFGSKSKMETYAKPDPYSFGYGVDDGLGTAQYRQETSNGDGVIKGMYGYKDFQGIYRHVEYTADDNGFHAVVKSNEPGVSNTDSADVVFIANAPL
ncbi:hypothetical protein JTE90_004227 [Oedothorax gibbosus]|uniref:Cuticle protein n=1 Tax=Oedothorax gibbosus TaxID=931172 RepID=A0AAV6URR8_9ARAC|nr:hypothetical protein JTE90_004227 [Oedothorax gibbosus]